MIKLRGGEKTNCDLIQFIWIRPFFTRTRETSWNLIRSHIIGLDINISMKLQIDNYSSTLYIEQWGIHVREERVSTNTGGCRDRMYSVCILELYAFYNSFLEIADSFV